MVEQGEDATELTKAIVVSLYKKGRPSTAGNYRPIALLKALYKIYAGILKARIEEGIEEDIPKHDSSGSARRGALPNRYTY